MGDGARRARVPAREPRRPARRRRARGGGGRARARHRGACSTAPTHELSGGELQRVALGAALAGRPRLVLLDEPTSQLDPVAGDELLGLLRRLNEEWGTAVVLAEHRLERCLAARRPRDRAARRAVACDADAARLPRWAAEHAPALQTPAARLFARAGLRPPPAASRRRAPRCARTGCCAERAGLADEPHGAAPRGGAGRARRCAACAARRAGAPAPPSPRATSGSSCAAAARSCAASTSRSRRASASR